MGCLRTQLARGSGWAGRRAVHSGMGRRPQGAIAVVFHIVVMSICVCMREGWLGARITDFFRHTDTTPLIVPVSFRVCVCLCAKEFEAHTCTMRRLWSQGREEGVPAHKHAHTGVPCRTVRARGSRVDKILHMHYFPSTCGSMRSMNASVSGRMTLAADSTPHGEVCVSESRGSVVSAYLYSEKWR